MNGTVIRIPRGGAQQLTGTAEILDSIRSMTDWIAENGHRYRVDVGKKLIELKAEAKKEGLKWGDVCEQLPFSQQHATRFMSIAKNEALANLTHELNSLPQDTNTVYALSRIPAPQLEKYIEAGQVKPDMSRAEASALARSKKKTPKKESKIKDEAESEREQRRAALSEAWEKAAPSDRQWFLHQNREWFVKNLDS